jgi:AcrR family transcriptional regulator
MTTEAPSARSRRTYSSPKRREQAAATRAVVLDQAVAMFAERGWAATGMRDIAGAAGVSVETVYAAFGSKTELMMAAIDLAVVGDTAPVALGSRPEFLVLGDGTMTERARAAARLAREVNERTVGLHRALREGAASDAALAHRLAAGERRRRTDVAHATRLVARRRVTPDERDGVWALVSTEVYELLVERTGWTGRRYERWIADTIARLLPPGGGTG